jgi:superfamily II DNA or RNA helicase
VSIILRSYQESLLSEARALMRRGIKSLIIESPTGSGKSALAAYMEKSAAAKGMTCWFIMHRAELLRQSIATFSSVGVDFGIISSGYTETPSKLVQLATIGTLSRRLSRLRHPNLIIWDESHHAAARSWSKIHAAYPQAFHVGLTATPERLDGKGLGKYFSRMVQGPEVRWLIENGYLSDYQLIVPPGTVNVAHVATTMGDFNKTQLAAVSDTPTIVGNAVREYQRYASGKRAIARGVSILHSQHIAAQFNAAGIPARHVDGETPDTERRAAMDSFVSGKTLVLSNVDLFSEGVDVPSVECVIDLRPTQSLSLWLQFCGRALRPAPGKKYAAIIDMAGNYGRHGLPCEVRDWSLEGRKKKTGGSGGTRIRVCALCRRAQTVSGPRCQFPPCEYVFPAGDGRDIQTIEGTLVPVDLDKARAAKSVRREKYREEYSCKTIDDLRALGRKRGYQFPDQWANIRWQFIRKDMDAPSSRIE